MQRLRPRSTQQNANIKPKSFDHRVSWNPFHGLRLLLPLNEISLVSQILLDDSEVFQSLLVMKKKNLISVIKIPSYRASSKLWTHLKLKISFPQLGLPSGWNSTGGKRDMMFLPYFTGLHRSFFQLGFLAPPGLEVGWQESGKGLRSHTWLSLAAGPGGLWSWRVSVFGKEHWFFVGCFHDSKKIFSPLWTSTCSFFDEGSASFHLPYDPPFSPCSRPTQLLCPVWILSLCRSKFSPHVPPCQPFAAALMIFSGLS